MTHIQKKFNIFFKCSIEYKYNRLRNRSGSKSLERGGSYGWNIENRRVVRRR